MKKKSIVTIQPVNPDIDYYNPFKNPDAISIVKQVDGNWIGWTQKNGKVVQAREVGPETVLQKLLTHDGTE